MQRPPRSAALRAAFTAAQRRTAPCLGAVHKAVYVCFDVAPAVLYAVEKMVFFSLAGMVDDFLWRGVCIVQVITWWFALSLYVYFGSVEGVTALAWIRRRPLPLRLFISVILTPVVPLAAFVVSFLERRSFLCNPRRRSSACYSAHAGGATTTPVDVELEAPSTNTEANGMMVGAEVDQTVAPSHQRLVPGALASDVGLGRFESRSMAPDLWHALMGSYTATWVNLRLAASAPGHRLFLFSALCGSLPLALWFVVMHASTSSDDTTFAIVYFTAVSTVWVNLYRLCQSFSVGSLLFSLLLVRIDALTAGYNLERLFHDGDSDTPRTTLFAVMWTGRSVAFCLFAVALYIVNAVVTIRTKRKKRRHHAKSRKNDTGWWLAKEIFRSAFKAVACLCAYPAIAMTCESMKLTTLVIADALQRPGPEYTPALAGLLSFTFRHSGDDGDTHDARVKHFMLAAARARKAQLIRNARSAPGGEVSPAAISLYKLCVCVEGIAADTSATAMDFIRRDDVDGLDSRIDRPTEEPQVTRVRCMRVFVLGYWVNSLVGTVLPFIDVAAGTSTWSPWLQQLFLTEIAVWVFAALCFIPSVWRYARFRLATRRLPELCPVVRELDAQWHEWVLSYHQHRTAPPHVGEPNQSDEMDGSTARASNGPPSALPSAVCETGKGWSAPSSVDVEPASADNG